MILNEVKELQEQLNFIKCELDLDIELDIKLDPKPSPIILKHTGKLMLALDCSLRWTNVAVSLDGEILVSECHDIGRRQATELPVIVKNVLIQAGYLFNQIDIIAITNGPGYFTGIRIGVAYAAALAYGLGVKVIPVSTLHMLANSHKNKTQPILVSIYAGRSQVYAASFGCETNGCAKELLPGEYKINEIENWLRIYENIKNNTKNNIEILSDDPEKACLSFLQNQQNQNYVITKVSPNASSVTHIAWNSLETAVHPMNLKISYYKAPI